MTFTEGQSVYTYVASSNSSKGQTISTNLTGLAEA